jgi:hypothetical protein
MAGVVANCLFYFLFVNYQLNIRLSSETDYDDFAAKVVENIPPASTVYIYGYPNMYWGLMETQRDYRIVESVWLPDTLSPGVLEGVDYIVLTGAFGPNVDGPDLEYHLAFLERASSRSGMRLEWLASVGTKKRFAYWADIFILHGSP